MNSILQNTKEAQKYDQLWEKNPYSAFLRAAKVINALQKRLREKNPDSKLLKLISVEGKDIENKIVYDKSREVDITITSDESLNEVIEYLVGNKERNQTWWGGHHGFKIGTYIHLLKNELKNPEFDSYNLPMNL